MNEPPTEPKMHADEVSVDLPLVRRLLASQFPRWSDLPLERVTSTGTDNLIFRLGDELAVRLPRIGWAVTQIEKEHRWLNQLAPLLPVPVPEAVAQGAPGDGYPYPWLVYRWISGQDLMVGRVGDVDQLARDVAAFVVALKDVHLPNPPPAGRRGGPQAPNTDVVRQAIDQLGSEIDGARALAMWDQAIAAGPWNGPLVWVHGDLLPGNVLLRDGRVAGIVDWSAAGVGDPACDAMLAWALPSDARATYRVALNVDEATWARGRGWVVEQAVLFIPYYAKTIPDAVAAATRRLQAALADDA